MYPLSTPKHVSTRYSCIPVSTRYSCILVHLTTRYSCIPVSTRYSYIPVHLSTRYSCIPVSTRYSCIPVSTRYSYIPVHLSTRYSCSLGRISVNIFSSLRLAWNPYILNIFNFIVKPLTRSGKLIKFTLKPTQL